MQQTGNTNRPIRVLLVEDSQVYLNLLKRILSEDPLFNVVAEAKNGAEAVNYTIKYKPDIISMDLIMPIMDGLEATREIMQRSPVPIVIVSSIYNSKDIEMAISELDAGAVAVLPKPSGPADPGFKADSEKYKKTLRIMSQIKVVRRTRALSKGEFSNLLNKERDKTLNDNTEKGLKKIGIVAIGASAGGPEGIRLILSRLKPALPVPVVIVQHIDHHFVDGFANWLNSYSKNPVVVLENGMRMREGTVYVAPSGRQLRVTRNGVASLSAEVKNNGHAPSVDVLFKSIEQLYGGGCIAILLSGMGKDGAEGIKAISDSGGIVFLQDEESCLVYGMPGEAVKLGVNAKKLNPEEIADEINLLLNI